jgi:L-ribulose-5-phosphate 3-epimerase
MNIGIRLHDTAPAPLSARAAAAAAQGFACAHIALYKLLEPAPAPEAFSQALANRLLQELAPLTPAILGCYLNLAHPDEAIYRETLAQYLAHLRLCRWLSCGMVGTETGNPNAEYRFDPTASHTEEALSLFIRRLAPVVEEAERLHTVIAIEPVLTHIVHSPSAARRVLDAFQSSFLKIILDPVNLLGPENVERRAAIVAEALETLGPDIAAVHLKDFVVENGTLRTVPSGQGEMDDTPVLRFVARAGREIPVLLDNTSPANAAQARAHIASLAACVST